jgi:hypothetical protein
VTSLQSAYIREIRGEKKSSADGADERGWIDGDRADERSPDSATVGEFAFKRTNLCDGAGFENPNDPRISAKSAEKIDFREWPRIPTGNIGDSS